MIKHPKSKIRNSICRGKKGLSLIELVLAVTILSTMSLAMTALSASAARVATTPNLAIQLQNEISYVLRDMEKNLKSGQKPIVSVQNGIYTLTVMDPDKNPIIYSYDPTSKLLSRTMQGTTNNLSQGVLVPKVSPIFVASGSIVEINIAARKTVNGKIVSVPGVTKSILLRGALS